MAQGRKKTIDSTIYEIATHKDFWIIVIVEDKYGLIGQKSIVTLFKKQTANRDL